MRALILAAVLVAACGTSTAPSNPISPTFVPTPAATARPSPTALAAATPRATVLDGVPAQVIRLGVDATPIDVAYAFGSIWVASHHGNSVIRIDPATLMEVARIDVGDGPAWFAVTDDSIWVTLQNGRGMARIDPQTNTSKDRAGMWAPCGAPVVAFDAIWHSACDAHQVTRIDPVTYASTDITVGDQAGLVLAADTLIIAGPAGLRRIDPATNTVEQVGGPPGSLGLGWAGGTVWVSDDTKIFRVNPTTGKVVSTLPIAKPGFVTEDGVVAWLVEPETGAIMKIDLATNEILQVVTIGPGVPIARPAAGFLWATSYDDGSLWRLDP